MKLCKRWWSCIAHSGVELITETMGPRGQGLLWKFEVKDQWYSVTNQLKELTNQDGLSLLWYAWGVGSERLSENEELYIKADFSFFPSPVMSAFFTIYLAQFSTLISRCVHDKGYDYILVTKATSPPFLLRKSRYGVTATVKRPHYQWIKGRNMPQVLLVTQTQGKPDLKCLWSESAFVYMYRQFTRTQHSRAGIRFPWLISW